MVKEKLFYAVHYAYFNISITKCRRYGAIIESHTILRLILFVPKRLKNRLH